eukprot:6465426-Amphidinium_carterae.1
MECVVLHASAPPKGAQGVSSMPPVWVTRMRLLLRHLDYLSAVSMHARMHIKEPWAKLCTHTSDCPEDLGWSSGLDCGGLTPEIEHAISQISAESCAVIELSMAGPKLLHGSGRLQLHQNRTAVIPTQKR